MFNRSARKYYYYLKSKIHPWTHCRLYTFCVLELLWFSILQTFHFLYRAYTYDVTLNCFFSFFFKLILCSSEIHDQHLCNILIWSIAADSSFVQNAIKINEWRCTILREMRQLKLTQRSCHIPIFAAERITFCKICNRPIS